MNSKGVIRVLVVLVWAGVLLPGMVSGQSDCHVRNVILIIGDGLGLPQISYLLHSEKEKTTIEKFPVIGLQKTYSVSSVITDSGAAATAMACGRKTYNYAIGMSADTTPCRSLFEMATENGMRTGLVVTSSIVHATPAAFVAHQVLRGFHEAIADDLLHSGIDYFVGGGLLYFTDRYGDDRNLVNEFEDKGYYVSDYKRKSFRSFARRIEPRMGFFSAYTEPKRIMDGRESLAAQVEHALQVLGTYSTNGFLLMVEASQIDFACHANNDTYLLAELRDMDEAVASAYAYAKGRDDTLVLITGDHEAGMLALRESPDRKVIVEFTTKSHGFSMVPVLAFGPCAEQFAGVYENTSIFDRVSALLGF